MAEARARSLCYRRGVFEVTHGEVFVIVFVTVAVVSAPWWPRAGVAVARALGGGSADKSGPKQARRER
jgi:hypothetical protein